MEISEKDIEVGTLVLFEGSGFLFNVLSGALSVFDSDWRKVKPKYWHVGFISRKDPDKGWLICESLAGGIQENPVNIYKGAHYFKWFDSPPDLDKVKNYVDSHLKLPYDALAYVWVILATIGNKVFRVNIGRWQNESYMCWENLEEFCLWMNKPVEKRNRTITICDIYKAIK